MSDAPLGHLGWLDVTVDDAAPLRDFYSAVLGWTFEACPMKDADGEYEDYVMKSPDGEAVAGVCHRRGSNTAIPGSWIPYVRVASIDAAVDAASQRGGSLVDGPRSAGGDEAFAILRDPSGAHVALVGPKSSGT